MSAETRRTVLVVEDDDALRRGLTDLLEDEGHRVVAVRDGPSALRAAAEHDPDLVVLDVMLPGMDGYSVCRRLHEERIRGAILMLTARSEERDRVVGLRAGADDYVGKPFHLEELLLRVRALLRRVPVRDDRPRRARVGDLELDFERFEAWREGRPVRLSPREFKILRLLCSEPGRVVSRNELLDKVWGYDHFPSTRTVDNHIVKLRRAIEPDPSQPRYLLSVRGVGYKLAADAVETAPATTSD